MEIIDSIDYDFSQIEKSQEVSQQGWIVRSIQTDATINEFLKQHPKATIVSLGCGMDMTFSRVDNGKIRFYEIDLPDVIERRKKYYEDTDKHISISTSFLEAEYFEKIIVEDGVLFIAGGVFCYFLEDEMKSFFIKLADYFGEADVYFDLLSPKGLEVAKKCC